MSAEIVKTVMFIHDGSPPGHTKCAAFETQDCQEMATTRFLFVDADSLIELGVIDLCETHRRVIE